MTAVAGTQSDLSAWAKDLERFFDGRPENIGVLAQAREVFACDGSPGGE
jgi:hypothetical protein